MRPLNGRLWREKRSQGNLKCVRGVTSCCFEHGGDVGEGFCQPQRGEGGTRLTARKERESSNPTSTSEELDSTNSLHEVGTEFTLKVFGTDRSQLRL